MKKIFLISALFLGAFCIKADAQLSVQLNIGRQPIWGPTGYDYVNYYYLPDLDVYYDVNRGVFVYYQYGRWNFASSLPGRYGRYDLYNSYKVVINDRNPWLRNSYYHSHYYAYRGRHQQIIRDSRDERYTRGREHRDDDRRVIQRGDDRRGIERGNRDRGNGRIVEGRDNGRGNDGRNNGRGDGGGRDNGDHGRGNGGGHGDHNDHH